MLEKYFILDNKLVNFNYKYLEYCILDKKLTNFFINNNNNIFFNLIYKKYLKLLNKNNFFLDFDKNKIKKYDFFNITLITTNNCNLNCLHCFNMNKDIKYYLDFNNFEKFSNKYNVLEFTFTGGEFFTHPYYYKFIEYSEKNDIMYSIYSNGINIYEKIKHFIFSKFFYELQLSIESINKKHNDFIRGKGSTKKFLKTLEQITDINYKISIAITLNTINIDDIEETIYFIYKNFGIKRFKLSPLIIKGNAKKNNLENIDYITYNTFIDKIKLTFPFLDINKDFISTFFQGSYDFKLNKYIKKTKCNAFDKYITIDPNGDILPCNLFFNENINKLNINNANSKNNIKKFYNFLFKNFDNRCINCEFKNNCEINCLYILNTKNLNEICLKYKYNLNKVTEIENIYNKLIKKYKLKNYPNLSYLFSDILLTYNDYYKNTIFVNYKIIELYDLKNLEKLIIHEIKHFKQQKKYNFEKILKYIEKLLPNYLAFNKYYILNFALDILIEKKLFNNKKNIISNINKIKDNNIFKNNFLFFVIHKILNNENYFYKFHKINNIKTIIKYLVNDFLNYINN